jgi:hypothetical protein
MTQRSIVFPDDTTSSVPLSLISAVPYILSAFKIYTFLISAAGVGAAICTQTTTEIDMDAKIQLSKDNEDSLKLLRTIGKSEARYVLTTVRPSKVKQPMLLM